MADLNTESIYRTSPTRTFKMLIIMLGLCAVGALIFFSMWDFWISQPPYASITSITTTPPATITGNEISVQLSFIESSDFRTLAFNALPGENGHNPELKVKSGDIITIKSINNGKSFHAFGITKDPEDFNNIIWDSAIASSSNPLKPGESSQTTFTAGEPGTYYYICTVPGHAIQGMQGTFIVE